MSLWSRRVRIRRLRAGDAALWRDLRLEALANHPEAYGSTHDDWAGRPLADFADRLESGTIFGAFVGTALVGSTALDADGPGQGSVTAVYVQAPYRGRNIARRLLKAASKAAKQQGMTRLVLSVAEGNDAARRFYYAAGFRDVGGEPRALARNGKLLEVSRMQKDL